MKITDAVQQALYGVTPVKHKHRIVKRISVGFKPLDPNDLPTGILTLMHRHGKRYITRNSRCLCHSGKRFKKCCGINVKGVKK